MRVLSAVCVVAAIAAVCAVAPGRAAPAADVRLAGYCSQTGDLCFGIFRRDREIVFSIDTFARYFSRYTLCVRGPDGVSRCGSYPIFRRGPIYGSNVRWSRNFPNLGPGVYRVTWKRPSHPLGPTLRFRR